MKLKIINSILVVLAVIFLASCSKSGNNKQQNQKYDMFNKNLITANKYLVKEDAEHIKNYIKRRNWQMIDGEGGLKYMITSHGEGDSVKLAPSLTMDYRVELLDGTLCYSSETDGSKQIVFGSSEMEPGLIRAFQTLCHGDKAVFILPPHFAKGLIGDMNKIPPHSVIVYFLEIK